MYGCAKPLRVDPRYCGRGVVHPMIFRSTITAKTRRAPLARSPPYLSLPLSCTSLSLLLSLSRFNCVSLSLSFICNFLLLSLSTHFYCPSVSVSLSSCVIRLSNFIILLTLLRYHYSFVLFPFASHFLARAVPFSFPLILSCFSFAFIHSVLVSLTDQRSRPGGGTLVLLGTCALGAYLQLPPLVYSLPSTAGRHARGKDFPFPLSSLAYFVGISADLDTNRIKLNCVNNHYRTSLAFLCENNC